MHRLSPEQLPLPSWRTWLRTGWRKIGRDAQRLTDVAALFAERCRQRRALCALDDRTLKDIGLDRSDVWRESRKPWWRA
jgi:uncharacterized protein YjiS (DUF1127 family)